MVNRTEENMTLDLRRMISWETFIQNCPTPLTDAVKDLEIPLDVMKMTRKGKLSDSEQKKIQDQLIQFLLQSCDKVPGEIARAKALYTMATPPLTLGEIMEVMATHDLYGKRRPQGNYGKRLAKQYVIKYMETPTADIRINETEEGVAQAFSYRISKKYGQDGMHTVARCYVAARLDDVELFKKLDALIAKNHGQYKIASHQDRHDTLNFYFSAPNKGSLDPKIVEEFVNVVSPYIDAQKDDQRYFDGTQLAPGIYFSPEFESNIEDLTALNEYLPCAIKEGPFYSYLVKQFNKFMFSMFVDENVIKTRSVGEIASYVDVRCAFMTLLEKMDLLEKQAPHRVATRRETTSEHVKPFADSSRGRPHV